MAGKKVIVDALSSIDGDDNEVIFCSVLSEGKTLG